MATARRYMYEALADPENDANDADAICSSLAWAEDDPDVATALLQRSCANEYDFYRFSAMHLAIFTHSDELAEFYFQRWSEAAGPEKVAGWLAGKVNMGPTNPEIEAWKKRHSKSP